MCDTSNGSSSWGDQIPFDEEDTLAALLRYGANGRQAGRRTTTDSDLACGTGTKELIFWAAAGDFEFLHTPGKSLAAKLGS